MNKFAITTLIIVILIAFQEIKATSDYSEIFISNQMRDTTGDLNKQFISIETTDLKTGKQIFRSSRNYWSRFKRYSLRF
jgi:hypothetical protein